MTQSRDDILRQLGRVETELEKYRARAVAAEQGKETLAELNREMAEQLRSAERTREVYRRLVAYLQSESGTISLATRLGRRGLSGEELRKALVITLEEQRRAIIASYVDQVRR